MGQLQLISSVNANSGNRASSFSFTSIPSTYTDLMIYASMRGTQGAQTVSATIYINNSQANNYQLYELTGSGTTANAQSFTFTSGAFTIPANSGLSNTFSASWIYLPNYLYTSSNKTWLEDSTVGYGTASSASYIGVATQNSTTTVSQIDIYVTAGNIAQYSTAYLYGIEFTP